MAVAIPAFVLARALLLLLATSKLSPTFIPAAHARHGAARLSSGLVPARHGEKALLYLSDRSRAAHLPTRAGYSVRSSPQDPDGFLFCARSPGARRVRSAHVLSLRRAERPQLGPLRDRHGKALLTCWGTRLYPVAREVGLTWRSGWWGVGERVFLSRLRLCFSWERTAARESSATTRRAQAIGRIQRAPRCCPTAER